MCLACGGVAEDMALADYARNKDARYEFSVPGMSCGACVSKIEKHLSSMAGIGRVRANLTLKRVVVEASKDVEPNAIVAGLKALSFDALRIDDDARDDDEHEKRARTLLRAVAVAGFGSANIMLLSVSAWSGAEDVTRDMFHFISALIAVPVVAYSGQPFFRSALAALKGGRVNMDVPISLAVLLAVGMSIFQTFAGEQHAYFDAAVMLLFFLLIGRYLDQLMRARARSAVVSLSEYAARDALRVMEDGNTAMLAVDAITPGMTLRLLPGSRVPTDCTIIKGTSDLDRSMVTGESDPVGIGVGDLLEAGTLNLTGSVDVRVDKSADQSFLSEVTRMLDAAEHGKGQYVRVADKAARSYTPVVHTVAAAAFTGWMFYTGGDWQTSLMVAISTLIITCPCALGLAVPVAHVVSASRLFRNGLLMRDGAALEKLARVKRAVFDKTGTVTTGVKKVDRIPEMDGQTARIFASLASHSSHPSAMAIVEHFKPFQPATLEEITEMPGRGIRAMFEGRPVAIEKHEGGKGTALVLDGKVLGIATFREELREGVMQCMQGLHGAGVETQLLSGDAQAAVEVIAAQIGEDTYHFAKTPQEKLDHVQALTGAEDQSVLMVGDGINDAPCLAAADVSIAPSSAADVGRQAADFVMARGNLSVIPWAIDMARATDHIVRQNFKIAVIYNFIAVPLAVAGMVTPLIAAIAMSGSSIIVIANSLRLLKMNEAADETAYAKTRLANPDPAAVAGAVPGLRMKKPANTLGEEIAA